MLYEPINYNTFANKLGTEQRPVQCTLYAESQTNQCLKGLKHIVRGQKTRLLAVTFVFFWQLQHNVFGGLLQTENKDV